MNMYALLHLHLSVLRRAALLLTLVAMMLVIALPQVANAQVNVVAGTAGFGAALAYGQSVGPVAFTQASSMGNGFAGATAITPFSAAGSFVQTTGPGIAFAQAIGTPFGSSAFVQVSSLPGGTAFGAAAAMP
jgi:hypothetical protein